MRDVKRLDDVSEGLRSKPIMKVEGPFDALYSQGRTKKGDFFMIENILWKLSFVKWMLCTFQEQRDRKSCKSKGA